MADGYLTFDTKINEKGFNEGIKKLGDLGKSGLAAAGKAVAGITAALGAGTIAGTKYNAVIEQYQTSFEVMTGSAEKASKVVKKLTKIGAETPFEMTGLADTTQLLMNYGLTADDAIDKMMMLGDISQGSADKMTRIATAYGQMSSAGKVQLEDIKQMIEAGFNPLQEISQTTGESMKNLYDRISKGTISVDEITAAMQRSTSEGGKYFQSMEKQSQTVSGQLSTLSDNAQQLLGSLTSGVSKLLGENILPEINELLGSLNNAYAENGFVGLIDEIGEKIPILQNVTDTISDLAGKLQGMSTDELMSLGKAALVIAGTATSLPLFGKGIETASTAVEGLNGITGGITTSIGSLPKAFQTVKGSASSWAKIFGNLGDAIALPFQDLGGVIANKLSPLGSVIKNKFSTMLSGISGVLSPFGNVIKNKFSTMFSGISGAFSKVGTVFGKVGSTISGYTGIIGDAFKPILKKAASFVPAMTKCMNIAAVAAVVVAGLGLLYNQFGGEIDNLLLMVQTKGPEIITNFCNGITEALPNLIAQGGTLLNNLMLAINANLPAIITGGISIISALITGIAEQLPTLLPTALQMILTLVIGLLSNVGQLVDAGINLLTGLAEGILNALPVLIENAPTIIGELVSAIISNLPKILTAGIEIIGKLATGIIEAVPQLLEKIPDIIDQVKNEFTSIDWGEVGSNIIDGITNGLKSAAGALVEAAAGAATDALNWVKEKLDIHSPSGVFRDQVGKMMALGMGIGFEKNIPVRSMSKGVQTAVESLKKDVAFTTSAKQDTSVNGIKKNPLFNPDPGTDWDEWERRQRKLNKERDSRPIFLGTERIDRPLPKGAIPAI